MRVLVIDRQPPLDLRQGNSLIGRHIFPRLAHSHELTLLCPVRASDEGHVRDQLLEWFTEVQLVEREGSVAALKGYLEASAGNHVPAVLRPGGARWADQFAHRLQQLVAARSFDVIHARELPMAAYLPGICHPAKLLELIDSTVLREQRRRDAASPFTWPRVPLARSLERRALQSCNVATTVAPADAAALHELVPDADVRTIRNGVDSEYFQPDAELEEPERVLFAGALSYSPNIAAVDFFHRSVWPQVRRRFPLARFVICGRDPAPEIRALAGDPSVVVTGEVDDIREWYARATVVVCPMTSGSGIKNKVLEAMAMERAIVASPLAVEALDVRHDVELRIADTPLDFAERCCELLVDQHARRRLGAAGRAYVVREHSWDACASAYDALYHELTCRESHAVNGATREAAQ